DVGDLHPEVVHAATVAGALDQHQLERRLGHREVGVAVAHLRRIGAEQLAVEGDRGVEVVDVEGELESGHEVLLDIDVGLCLSLPRTSTYVNIDVCRSLCWSSRPSRLSPAAHP